MMKVLYNFFKGIYIFLICSFYDFMKGIVYSNMVFKKKNNKQALMSNIMINIHRIEKGLTFPKTKLLFGKWFFPKLFKDIKLFNDIYGETYPKSILSSSLNQYKELHIKNGISESEYPLNQIHLKPDKEVKSGFKMIGELHNEEPINDFHEFALRRSSIRNFTTSIEKEDLKKALTIALNTPSVCNRQPWKVYYYTEKENLTKLLTYQNGNLGFRDSIPGLIIITGNLKEMEFPFERHQIYIEGGLFSMSLINALHSMNIGTCCLNWCSKPYNDYKAHKEANIPLDQEIIMYMAVGHYNKDIKVTVSPKKPISLISDNL